MDLIIFFAIYSLSVVYLLWSNLRYELNADRVGEYRVFERRIGRKPPLPGKDTVDPLGWCYLVFGLPYILWRFFKVNEHRAFRVTPAFFYALFPAFVFLVARQWFGIPLSLLSVSVAVSNYYFIFDTDMGRVAIAWGLLAGAVWALLSFNLPLFLLFSILVFLAHYGTAYYFLFVLGVAWSGAFIFNQPYLPFLSLASLSYLVLMFFWQKFLTMNMLTIGVAFIKYAIRFEKIRYSKGQAAEHDPPGMQRVIASFFECRDYPLKSAFGLNWKLMKIPQRMELVTSWLVVIAITVGLVASSHKLELLWFLGAGSYVAVLLSIAVPHISKYYGVVRTYASGLVFLAPLAVEAFARWNLEPIFLVLLGVHALLLSGLVHPFWKIDKYAQQRVYTGNR